MAQHDPVRVLVTLGTDHHRFDRLLGWVEHVESAAQVPVQCTVQHGSTPLPERLQGFELLPHAELLALMASHDVVVAQGGPGSVMDARRCGRLPIVVPRLRRHGEVVDDHQVAFCHAMAELDMVRVADSEGALAALLDAACRDPQAFRVSADVSHVAETVERIDALISSAVAPRRHGLRWRGRHRSQARSRPINA